MDANTESEFCLQELLKVALGHGSVTTFNTMVLHSLLELVLIKLSCANEKVSIGGYDSKIIEGLLQTSNISPLPFNSEKMEPADQFDNLEQLESTIDSLEDKINEHLEEVRMTGEHICTTCDPDIKQICDIIGNSDFKHTILKQILPPIYSRFQAMSKKLDNFEAEFISWSGLMEEHLKKMSWNEYIIKSFDNVENHLNAYRADFIKVMENLQDIMDTKVDRADMLLLQDSAAKKFRDIQIKLNDLIVKAMKPKATVIVIESPSPKPLVQEEGAQSLFAKCDCKRLYLHKSSTRSLAKHVEQCSQKSKLSKTFDSKI
ncbi:unnamed protein product [Ceratitis capitata]|uniref:(Mediterranean fruit fly) hypothetical protein n=1 Tax=Ceratitis capitata TaxID=7213 RepID=W8C119_CERCA|nr:unnamed protein product [Ceratitis capitata]